LVRRSVTEAPAKSDIVKREIRASMPEKRGEVIEKADASQMMPDIYENWLKKQRTGDVKARSGFIGGQDTKLAEEEEEDREEDQIDKTEDAHEKAKRRKRAKTTH
jgi:hypothetical protein